MHSTLYQIATAPIEEKYFLNEDSIPCGEGADLDYVDERKGENRLKLIKVLVSEILPQGMFQLKGNDRLEYQGGYDEWRIKWVDEIHEKANAVTVGNVNEWAGATYQLQKALENPFGCGTLFCIDGEAYPEKSAALMRNVSYMEKGDCLYIGSVFDYHW